MFEDLSKFALPVLPEKLYRFRKLAPESDPHHQEFLARAIDEIEHANSELCELYFSPISSFGDLYEAKPEIANSPPEEIYQIIRHFWQRPKDSPLLDGALRHLGIKWCNRFEDTDFIERLHLVDCLRGCSRRMYSLSCAKTNVACLVESYEDQKMWQDYANYGHGYVMEFALRDDYLDDVSDQTWSGQYLAHMGIQHHGHHYRKIVYSDLRPKIFDAEILRLHPQSTKQSLDSFTLQFLSNTSVNEFLDRAFFTKNVDFKSENEWRFINTGLMPGYHPLRSYRLSSIIFGPRTALLNETVLLEKCRDLRVAVTVVRPSLKGYTFERKEHGS